MEGLWQTCVEQGCQCHFPKAFPLFVFLCPVLVILSVSNIFISVKFARVTCDQ